MTEERVNLPALLETARESGLLSDHALSILLKADPIDLGIISPDGIRAREVTFAVVGADDSYSITDRGAGEFVAVGHNIGLVQSALDELGQRAASRVFLVTKPFLGGLVNGFVPLVDPQLQRLVLGTNYNPTGNRTPLYDIVGDLIAAVYAKWQQFRAARIKVRVFFAILSDGEDNGSCRFSDEDIHVLITELLQTGEVTFVGIGVGDMDFFRRVYSKMGIPMEWIRATDNTNGIVEVMRTASSSLVSVSRGIRPTGFGEGGFDE